LPKEVSVSVSKKKQDLGMGIEVSEMSVLGGKCFAALPSKSAPLIQNSFVFNFDPPILVPAKLAKEIDTITAGLNQVESGTNTGEWHGPIFETKVAIL
jgi:hypothetical protein